MKGLAYKYRIWVKMTGNRGSPISCVYVPSCSEGTTTSDPGGDNVKSDSIYFLAEGDVVMLGEFDAHEGNHVESGVVLERVESTQTASSSDMLPTWTWVQPQ